MALFEMLLTHAASSAPSRHYHRISHRMRESDFLCYDPRYLVDCYRDETCIIGTYLPYIEQERFLGNSWAEFVLAAESLRIAKVAKPFELAKCPPLELSDFQAQALAQFKKEGKLDRDDPVLRLDALYHVIWGHDGSR